MTPDVVIVGGGITGLALCHELRRRGAGVQVLEARERPGGVIGSVEREGRILDLGPQRTRLTPAVRRLVEELGLGDELLEAPSGLPLYVLRAGRLRRVPAGVGELVRTDLLSAKGKLRLLLEPFTGGTGRGESVADFLRRTVGEEAYLHLFGPLYGGIYASDPRDMPMEHSLGRALREHDMEGSLLVGLGRRLLGGGEVPPPVSFRRGMRELPERLARRHADVVRLGVEATEVEEVGGGLRVRTAGGEILRAEVVVLAVPAPAASSLLRAAAPRAARALASLRYNPLAVVHLLSRLDRPGYGFQVSLADRALALRGATWNYSLFGRDELSTAYLGGALRPDVAAGDDGPIARRAAREFTRITGAPARPVHVHRTRMPAFDESWRALRRVSEEGDLPDGLHLCASYQIRPGIPGRLRHAERTAGRLTSATSSNPQGE